MAFSKLWQDIEKYGNKMRSGPAQDQQMPYKMMEPELCEFEKYNSKGIK